jgi:4-amino-4-deoxy-L-arabinose transferase-like glycosyltransferase
MLPKWPVLLLIFSLGLGIRLYDLTDPPLDYHPTRQLRSAIIARGMYSSLQTSLPEEKRLFAVEQLQKEAIIEPVVMESLVAASYALMGSEYVWVARLYSSLFWFLGGLAIFGLAREWASFDGAMVALMFYFFNPFGVIASRTFQPDPLMVALLAGALWAICGWYKRQTWGWAVIAGLLSGMAIFVKSVAIFPLIMAMAGLLLVSPGWRTTLTRGQVWCMVGLAILPGALYHVYGIFIDGFLSQQFNLRFFPSFLVSPSFYIRWLDVIGKTIGFGAFFLALSGVLMLLYKPEGGLAIGFLMGYFVYGMTLPHHITTHDYYQLPLVPIVALLLAPVAAVVFEYFGGINRSLFSRLGLSAILVLAVLTYSWQARSIMARTDFRPEIAKWEELGRKLVGSRVVALTHDYGYRLVYYGWLPTEHWPHQGDMRLLEMAGRAPIPIKERFNELTQDMDYFLVVQMEEFQRQPELQEILYSHYPLISSGSEAYLLFELKK